MEIFELKKQVKKIKKLTFFTSEIFIYKVYDQYK